ncbi:hypothetical protein [Allorhodopirellula solitaria]|uniref:Uncharacterized protein n=1 Tax=Allorhodopirellula solitaria TaxID=2527987 RepID=A0A5C5XVN4_9BACT|nr:hypothetical protein [Allorhodopirellula solitaria]TWT66581.1 hypothetical protein CA85_26780 [Allorhodopirellula solitaria]
MKTTPTPSDPSWFERPSNIRKMIIALVIICTGLALADLFYTNPHPHFPIETSFAFQAWFGFVSFVVIVFLGRLLRVFVSRPEDYYESQEADHDSDR